jgi:hypothetical protein
MSETQTIFRKNFVSQIESSLMFAHRANIKRYQNLLATDLSEDERLFVQKRLAEEKVALRRLEGNSAPEI